jgi:hypothetical protein
MDCLRIAKGFLVSLALVSLCLPEPLFAMAPMPQVADVALMNGGVLVGQVVDAQGVGLAGAPVTLQSQDGATRTAQTDAQGRFSVAALPAGLYQLTAGNSQGTCRLWAPQTAPPAAQQGVTLVNTDTLRGQNNCNTCRRGLFGAGGWLTNPWVVAGIVATAVAVPVAIHNSRRHPSSP